MRKDATHAPVCAKNAHQELARGTMPVAVSLSREVIDITGRLGSLLRPEYRTSLQTVDQQHIVLFDLYRDVEHLLNSSRNMPRITRRLETMIDCARQHFADEEAEMAEIAYPGLSEHQAVHQRLLRNIVDVRACLPRRLSSVDAAAVAAYLRFWLVQHIHVEAGALSAFAAPG